MFDTSIIELSSKALKNNINFIKSRLDSNVKICSIVKGNAYGHGFAEFVEMGMMSGLDYFGVHAAEEAYRLIKRLKKTPDIFIMGDMDEESIPWAIENSIEFSVFDFLRLEKVIQNCKLIAKKAKIHIEIETGMRRTGFEPIQFDKLIEFLKNNSDFITTQGIFTHLAGAESLANNFRVKKQLKNFEESIEKFKYNNIQPKYKHIACSAVVLNYPEIISVISNMVRVGILQYGFWPNTETFIRYSGDKEGHDPLKRVMRWSTKIMAFKEVNKGDFIGYGTSYLAHRKMKLAILPIGYSHGYGRNLSNLATVLINGKHCEVVGTVNMNSMTVNITNAGIININDEVVLIGKQKNKEITVSSFSEQIKQLNYEMLTRLPYGIQRVIK